MTGQWNHNIFSEAGESFERLSLDTFHYQSEHCPVYRDYLNALNIRTTDIVTMLQIPFLPVRFFKTHTIMTGDFKPAVIFESSGTTGTAGSRHYVRDTSMYEESFTRCFEMFYGPVQDWCIIALLPSYLERKNSSLVYMTEKLVRKSNHPQSGFYLDEFEKLSAALAGLEQMKQKTLLIGVTFALLDFCEKFPQELRHTIVMETGGMKGRREELIRDEVHGILKKAFGMESIHSEYGMTELMSQAYSDGDGIFSCPPWMKILIRDEEDPFAVKTDGRGIINVVDLANINSCSFIATDDAGRLNHNGTFEVLGRADGSDLRGCSLMVV